MFGSMFRGLLTIGAVVLAAMAVLMVVKMAVVMVIFLLTLLLPALFVYWLVSQAARGWQAPQRHAARCARRRFQWETRRAVRQAAPEQSSPRRPDLAAREASDLAADIARLVRRSDRQTRGILASAPGSARKLSDRVRELARLCATLEEHLREGDSAGYLRQAAEMQARADSTGDAFARDQYREAAQSLEAQAQICAELTRTRERLHAEIARILAALTNLRTRIVALVSSPAAESESAARAADELADLESQVGTFQESVSQVLRQVPQQSR